ncbi:MULTISPECIES: hypothetical protein [unclassified Enterococcus]|uniref:hypothetical protein n=1 Tax=unclassified Enterococcus TaxID=2608891 RepID=UPI00155515E3|nr:MULTISPECIES: hypothetical protein [unclassified Enterococcus]MBS7577161.1 hypothetical protein [Enterococcus sp. MMGLQ5-2]MBS7584392.1 hypothetical protein [Enterococcus sp. MMGLQ5-1]NPD12247.1 hypothetical protein [Enterococcus sp. MMGLQ5-1]NPD36995.1 hypothetical protein [Enterococcus sp. MMGLQ5-2]
MEKIYCITTHSGSKYVVLYTPKGKWLERLSLGRIGSLRKDKEKIKIYKILKLSLGEPAIFILEPLRKGDFTLRQTTKVTKIKIITKIFKK